MMSDKYRMFKNYMYNDLGITKEDIKNWTKEAVKEVALEYITHHMDDWDIKRTAERGIHIALQDVARDYLKAMVKDDYELSLKKK